MIFSKPCQYAILAMTYLAEQESGRLSSIREISERGEIPMPFLSKIITRLSRHGLVTARRGPKGGVMLARPSGDVSVGDIVEAVDGALDDGRCQLGFRECVDSDPCPVHDSWKQVREKLDRTLHAKTLNDLIRSRKKGATTKPRPKAETGS